MSLRHPTIAGLTIAFCAGASSMLAAQEAKPEPKGGYTVGFVSAAIGLPFYQAMKCAADKAAGAHNINLIWQGSQSIAPRDEMQVLEAVAAQKPDGIILVPWDSTAFVAPTRKLIEGGTPVITVDGSLVEPADLQNIRTSNLDAGKQAARDVAQLIGHKGSVLILTAAPGNAVQNERWTGFKQVLDTHYKDIKLLDVQYVGSDAGKAAAVTSASLVANADLAAIYTTQDAGAEGAANALRAAGKRGQVRVIAYDATLRQVELLKAGEFDALVAQSPRDIGTQMIESIYKELKDGKEKAALPYQVHAKFKFLTRENVNTEDSKGYIYSPDCK
ncbi:substrate-binding domain-containing protein [Bradyrhizobium jicamae]|uniref:substrate-binding domain-containing protein n=1 Tax=Bradyrhizobium jicamae TaxID=280332 RepID=UPI001BAA18F8|nr:substrate-binding domain-containing protein [Bradyrhizobium jicamae]MBR0936047.1 substrate-binding domain-containing protein [Bradyrhizobium jicamae]